MSWSATIIAQYCFELFSSAAPMDHTAFTSVHLQTSIWGFFSPQTHSHRIPMDNFLLTGTCSLLLQQNKKTTCFNCLFKEVWKGTLWNSKTQCWHCENYTIRQAVSVFLLAVSPNLSLNKTLNWQDEEQKRVKCSKCIILGFFLPRSCPVLSTVVLGVLFW